MPTLERESLRRVLHLAAAFLPLALVALALAGVLWADVPLRERFDGLAPYAKLLLIPFLLWQFSYRDGGKVVLWTFLISCCVLLAASWLTLYVPALWRFAKQPGIPVRDYIIQSGVFTLCSFALLQQAITTWKQDNKRALGYALLACLFLANIIFAALARTTLIVIVVLFALLGLLYLRSRGVVMLTAMVVALAALSWTASPYLRWRVMTAASELQNFAPESDTSTGARMEFWRNSLEIIRAAPLLGHGTGSMPAMFARQTGVAQGAPNAASNPHNQIFAVAIPLGLAGVFVLVMLWAAHIRLFAARDFPAWIGLTVVVQNIVSSLFNSHLLDFSQGWLYVLGVGVAGGMVLRTRSAAPVVSPPS